MNILYLVTRDKSGGSTSSVCKICLATMLKPLREKKQHKHKLFGPDPVNGEIVL